MQHSLFLSYILYNIMIFLQCKQTVNTRDPRQILYSNTISSVHHGYQLNITSSKMFNFLVIQNFVAILPDKSCLWKSYDGNWKPRQCISIYIEGILHKVVFKLFLLVFLRKSTHKLSYFQYFKKIKILPNTKSSTQYCIWYKYKVFNQGSYLIPSLYGITDVLQMNTFCQSIQFY